MMQFNSVSIKNLIQKTPLILLGSLSCIFSSEALAAISYCTIGPSTLTWIQPVNPNATPYQDMKIGSVQLNILINNKVTNIRDQTAGYFEMTRTRDVTGLSHDLSLIPVPGSPGVSTRLTYTQFLFHSGGTANFLNGYGANVVPIPAPLYTDRGRTPYAAYQYTRSTGTKYHELVATVDLIITDIESYQGGTLDIKAALSNYRAVSGHWRWSYEFSTYIPHGGCGMELSTSDGTGTIEPPKKPTPTCSFDFLNKTLTVRLGTVSQSEIVANLSNKSDRSFGIPGQTSFDLNVYDCQENASFEMYFTDNQSPSETKNYLSTDKPGIGIRLYAGDYEDPIPFAPAPQGSTPGLAAVKEMSLPDKYSQNYKFYAQYIKLNNDNTPSGSINGQATVTVIYP